MSDVSGISGMSTDFMMNRMQSSQGMQGPPPGPPPTDGGNQESSEEMEEKLQSAADALGIDVETLKSINEEIRTAMDAAFESQDGTDSSAMKQKMDEAVENALSKYGVDADEYRTQMEAMRPEGMSGGPPGQQGAAYGATGRDTTSQSLEQFASLFLPVDEDA